MLGPGEPPVPFSVPLLDIEPAAVPEDPDAPDVPLPPLEPPPLCAVAIEREPHTKAKAKPILINFILLSTPTGKKPGKSAGVPVKDQVREDRRISAMNLHSKLALHFV